MPRLRRGGNLGRRTAHAIATTYNRQNLLPNTAINIDQQYLEEFKSSLDALAYNCCNNCHRLNLSVTVSPICSACVKNPQKFTALNKMDPGDVPLELQNLSVTEQMLIARVHPVMKVYQVRANGRPGQYRYSGNVVNIEQDITTLASRLPNLTSELNIIIVQREGVSGMSDFRVRRQVVSNALKWLKNNNLFYRDIEISAENTNALPEDGNIARSLRYIHEGGVSTENDTDENITETAVPMQRHRGQQQQLETVLRWPSGNPYPINEFRTEGYIAMAFPHIFPFGLGSFTDFTRTEKLTYQEWAKYLIQYHDQRFAKDPRFRFHALNTIQRHESLMRSGVFARKNDFTGNMQQLIQEFNHNPSIVTRLLSWASKIRGSSPYWYQRKLELQAMVNQLGIPTIFLTLSAADLWWPDLVRHFGVGLDADLTEQQLSKLMQSKLNENPLIADQYFSKRVDIFMAIVRKKFKVQDFWWRYEYQHRGSPHIHAILWLENAPDIRTFDICTSEEIETYRRYYDSLVSAINPNQNEQPAMKHPSRLRVDEILLDDPVQLPQLLNRVQRHTRHSVYCYRVVRGVQKCRFNFPKDTSLESRLAKDEKGVWSYTPKRNDPLLDDHNTFVAQVWRANTDLKVIVSEHAMINYLAKYASKAEPQSTNYKQMFSEILNVANQDSAAKHAFSKLLIKIVGQRDISACEVMHLLDGEPLYHASRQFVKLFISLQEYHLIADNDTGDQFVPHSILEHYAARQTSLESMSLLEFALTFNVCRGRLFRPRKQRVLQIIPKVSKDVSPEQDEIYYKQKLLLNLPWRDSNVVKTHSTWKDSYLVTNLNVWEIGEDAEETDNGIDDHADEPFEWMQLAAAMPNQPIIDTEIGYRNIDRDYDWYSNQHKYPDILNNLDFLKRSKEEHVEVREFTLSHLVLTTHQQKVVDHLADQLNRHVSSKLTIVQGAAGTGKSCVINNMVTYIRAMHGENSVLLIAPTGVAANNINGQTIHSALQLTLSRDGQIRPLTGENERKFQEKFSSLRVVICDEMSMVGLRLLSSIDERLRQAIPDSQDIEFGGIIFYLFGDFNQLPPVGDTSLVGRVKENSMPSLRGKLLFEKFDKVFTLTQVMRQTGSDQVMFKETLLNLASGNITQVDYAFLASRFKINIENDSDFESCLRIMAKKDDISVYNNDKLRSLNTPVAVIKAKNNNATASLASADEAQGLQPILHLSANCRIMLNQNLWTSQGLCNGTLGTVVDVVYAPNSDRNPSNETPACVLVKFDNYTGPTLCFGAIPVLPFSVGFTKNGTSCNRKQFPLTVAYAITIHKSQGISLDRAVIDIGTSEFGLGLTYVACSRVRSYQGLMLDPPFPITRILAINKHSGLMVRRGEMARLQNLSDP